MYLVMEYVAGQPLDGYLRSRPVALAERLRLFLETCSAVGEAHRNLIVHGDLKPCNVLMTGEVLGFWDVPLAGGGDQTGDVAGDDGGGGCGSRRACCFRLGR